MKSAFFIKIHVKIFYIQICKISGYLVIKDWNSILLLILTQIKQQNMLWPSYKET